MDFSSPIAVALMKWKLLFQTAQSREGVSSKKGRKIAVPSYLPAEMILFHTIANIPK